MHAYYVFKFPSSETDAPAPKTVGHCYKSVSIQTLPIYFLLYMYIFTYYQQNYHCFIAKLFSRFLYSRIVSHKFPSNN